MNSKKVGYINGNPVCGLSYRECIEVTKIFDGCVSQIGDQQFTLIITDPGGVPPYTFISAVSEGATSISNLTVVPYDDTKNRVSFDATIPVRVSFTDSTGTAFTAMSSITFHREVLLKLPQESLSPYSIVVTTSLRSGIGSFVSPTEISCRVCIVQVTKVTATVDMLVPTYGYAEFPACTEAGVCEGLNNLPLFPPLS